VKKPFIRKLIGTVFSFFCYGPYFGFYSRKRGLWVNEEEKILIGEEETMCNPIAQAEVCNDAGTELNILLGLCVGHDSLFIKYANAYTTVFAAKDHLLGHNPLALVYTRNSYYARFLEED